MKNDMPPVVDVLPIDVGLPPRPWRCSQCRRTTADLVPISGVFGEQSVFEALAPDVHLDYICSRLWAAGLTRDHLLVAVTGGVCRRCAGRTGRLMHRRGDLIARWIRRLRSGAPFVGGVELQISAGPKQIAILSRQDGSERWTPPWDLDDRC